jgi:ribosomal protein L11 methyltransferase
MSNRPDGSAVLARLRVDERAAQRLLLAAQDGFEEATIAAFEAGAGCWIVEVSSDVAPARLNLGAWVARAAVPQTAMTRVLEPVADRDWVRASLAGLRLVHAGRFVVHGAHDRHAVPAHRIGIEIEAALAFGTGHHGTTRGCLLALDHLLKALRPRRVLDVGTGTGVLALAAARALRGRVLASDIDRRAIRVADQNRRANHAASLVRLVHAAGLDAHAFSQQGPFDLVFANILLAPLKRLARPMARRLAPHASVVLSGLLASQASAILAAYRSQGLYLERRIALEGWVTLVLRNPMTPAALPSRARWRRRARGPAGAAPAP